ncbi:MAG: HlyD family type I secretion periplasmic adaptor subunit [Hyphomicrobiales bacterium]|nr:HlyD family type I secretion periplasmic adaptor subunit [Hyphomicrobiales bacterium]
MDATPPAKWMTSAPEREDLAFIRDAEAALHDAPSRSSAYFLVACASLFVIFLTWAYFAELEEVTRGDGRVIPSIKTQMIQSLEGGIVKSIYVREGDRVNKGQVLVRIDDTGFSSEFGELQAKELSLLAQISRLRTEAGSAEASEVQFPEELKQKAADVVRNETTLFSIRRSNLENQVSVLNERLQQRKQELAELEAGKKRFADGLGIANKELSMKAPLAQRGIVSKTDMLRLEREISDLNGQLATTQQSIPRVEASIREAERLIQEQKLTFRQTAQTELNAKLAELSIVQQSLKAAKDKVLRTDMRSPVEGIVNKLHVNTIGGVVRASEPLAEITPLEDSLLVEVRVPPADIAFISPNQKALVKLTAYDFTVYGGLDGKVEIISSDSIIDEATKESYYLVTVRTNESALRKGKETLPIIPGMVATVDIITGGKSVLDYILKPIVKARHEALRER